MVDKSGRGTLSGLGRGTLSGLGRVGRVRISAGPGRTVRPRPARPEDLQPCDRLSFQEKSSCSAQRVLRECF